MPRWQRLGKRLLLALLAACITLKLHLDLKLLSHSTSTPYSLWQRNETFLHKSQRNIISKESGSNIFNKILEVTMYQNVGMGRDLFNDFKARQMYFLQEHPIKNEILENLDDKNGFEEYKKKIILISPKLDTKQNIQNSNNSINLKFNDNEIGDNRNILNKLKVNSKYIATENQMHLNFNKRNMNLKNIDIVKEVKLEKKDHLNHSENISNVFKKFKEIIKVLNLSDKIEKSDKTIDNRTLVTYKIKDIKSEEYDKSLSNKKINVINNNTLDLYEEHNKDNQIQIVHESQSNRKSELHTNKSQYNGQDEFIHAANLDEDLSAKNKSNKSEFNQNEIASNSSLVEKNLKMFKGYKEIDPQSKIQTESMHNIEKEVSKASEYHLKSEKLLTTVKTERKITIQNVKEPPINHGDTSVNVLESLHKIEPKEKTDNGFITITKKSSYNPEKPHHIPMKIRLNNQNPKSHTRTLTKHPAPPVRNAQSKGVSVSHKIDESELSFTDAEIINITMLIQQINDKQIIYNLDKYGPITNDTVVFLIQVHNRLINLQHLVESLGAAQGINSSLVIFSHDLWHPNITHYIKSITTFRHMQMFFPFSIQLNPRSYPGRDPRDCSWNIHRNPNLKCLNREWPDSYGHFREAGFTQIKHHWWWKIYRLFEEVRVLRGGTWLGQVVFLEEDHIVASDILYVLRLMNQQRPSLCSSCNILTLGNYNKLAPSSYQNIVEKGDWWVTKYNLGFVLDYRIWLGIKACGVQFCEYDDYNWDWTLSSLIHSCIKPKLTMLSIRFSRVMHVGSCGTHVRKRNCDISKEVSAVKQRYKIGQQWLFPKTLKLQGTHRSSQKPKKGNGGWGDFRDKMLCRAISTGKATQNTIKSLQFLQQQEKT